MMLMATEGTVFSGGVVTVSLWVFLVLIAVKLVTLVRKQRENARVLEQFPGPARHWLLGHVHKFEPPDETGGLQWADDMAAEYVYGYPVWFGPVGYLNVTHPEYAKTILATTEPKDEFVYRFIKPWIGDGLLVSHGQKWFRNRRLLTPAFHFGVLQPHTRLFSDSTNIMMAKWRQLGAGASIDVFEHVSLMTLDSMLKCALTVESNCQVDRKQNSYIAAVFSLTKLALQRFHLFPLHSDLIYYLTPMGYRFWKLCKVVHQHSESVIRDRREALKKEQVQDSGQRRKYLDFLDILLKTKDEDGNGLSDVEIRDEVDTFMFEGHDTTASGLSWTLYNLARHPEHQERCRQEARSVLQGRSVVTGTDLSHLPYITVCIKESLRLHTAVPSIARKLTKLNCLYSSDLSHLPYITVCIKESLRLHTAVPSIARKLTKSVTFPDGKSLPPGSFVGISVWNIHHNPHVWRDPKVYDPSRFLPENCKGRHSHAFIPFSAGPRNCIGQHFAMNELKTAVALIVQSFRLSVDENHVAKGVMSLVLKAAEPGLFLKVTPLD
ncbi:cytochrome P450 4F2-like [Branchiostoma floridae x Branchiostoma japonicum]